MSAALLDHCPHSACTQHWIDTGFSGCVLDPVTLLPESDADEIPRCPCGGEPRPQGDSFRGFRVVHIGADGHESKGPVRDTVEEAVEAWTEIFGGER